MQITNTTRLQGVYLADVSSKSAQYCAASMSGGTGLLLLCEAELGKPMYEIPTGDSSAQEKAKEHGAIATLGVGQTAPQGWTDGEFIHEELKGVSLPDVSKGLGDNKAAKATGYLMFNEYDSSSHWCWFTLVYSWFADEGTQVHCLRRGAVADEVSLPRGYVEIVQTTQTSQASTHCGVSTTGEKESTKSNTNVSAN